MSYNLLALSGEPLWIWPVHSQLESPPQSNRNKSLIPPTKWMWSLTKWWGHPGPPFWIWEVDLGRLLPPQSQTKTGLCHQLRFVVIPVGHCDDPEVACHSRKFMECSPLASTQQTHSVAVLSLLQWWLQTLGEKLLVEETFSRFGAPDGKVMV